MVAIRSFGDAFHKVVQGLSIHAGHWGLESEEARHISDLDFITADSFPAHRWEKFGQLKPGFGEYRLVDKNHDPYDPDYDYYDSEISRESGEILRSAFATGELGLRGGSVTAGTRFRAIVDVDTADDLTPRRMLAIRTALNYAMQGIDPKPQDLSPANG